jgi:predicted enzyme related to lactoylglutathione lyase
MNGICHFEIPSKDFEKAKTFYGEVFGWKFNEMKEMNYMVFEAPSGVCGGFDHSYEIASKPGFAFYIEVANIDDTIKKAEGIGGKCAREKTQISPDYGYMAFINDLEGNLIGLWSKN